MRHHSRKVTADGYTFDSQAEHKRYEQLCLLEQAGQISGLKVHPKYTLMYSFVTPWGESVRGVTLSPDFEYTEQGRQVVEDVKPWGWNRRKNPPKWEPVCAEDFQLKRKWFIHLYPEIEFRIVEA